MKRLIIFYSYSNHTRDIVKRIKEKYNYDEIILCTPVWWYSVASPVNTFIHTYDLKGKVVIPVATNGGYLGRTFENIEKVTGCILKKSLSLKYDGDILSNLYEFEEWLNNLEEPGE